MSTPSKPAASATTSAEAKRRRRIGLVLLLVGLALAAGGFFLPWLRIDCSGNCGSGYGNSSWPLIRGPVMTDGLFLFVCWPAWLLVLVCAVLTAVQEFRRARRPTAVPALLLAGMLLVVQAIAFELAGIIGFGPRQPPYPVITGTLLPGCDVGPLGAVLVAVGGLLRYHPRRIATPRELTGIPAER